MAQPDVMVVSQARVVQQAIATVLGKCGLSTIVASTVEEARAILRRRAVSIIFCSDELPGTGVDDFVRQVTLPPKNVPVVMALCMGEWQSCLHFMDLGATDCVVYPLSSVEFERVTQNTLGLARPQKVQPRVHQPITGAA